MNDGLVWAVVYSNYYPEEVDSLWATEPLAQERANELAGDWNVVAKRVWQSRQEWEGLEEDA